LRTDLEIRLTICLNGCPIGPRIQRGEPLPKYQHTYNNTPDGLREAKKDMDEIQAYITRNQKIIKRK